MEAEKQAEESGSGVGLVKRKTMSNIPMPGDRKALGKSGFYNGKNRSGIYSNKKVASEI